MSPPPPAGDDLVEREFASHFDWAAPGDQQEDAWLVRFCDKDCGEAIFTGPDAEREAWEHWNRYSPSFNIYVFRLARLKPEAAALEAVRSTREGEIERLIELTERGLHVATVASCNCDHPANISPEPEAHAETCRYRVLYVAATALADARQALNKGTDEGDGR